MSPVRGDLHDLTASQMTVEHRECRVPIMQSVLHQMQLENALSQETQKDVASLFGAEPLDEETL